MRVRAERIRAILVGDNVEDALVGCARLLEGSLAPSGRFLTREVGDHDDVDDRVVRGVERLRGRFDRCALLVTQERVGVGDVSARSERLGRERGRAADQQCYRHDGDESEASDP